MAWTRTFIPGRLLLPALFADDIAEYYIAHAYDQVSSWIAERKAQA
jgi:hypothetical protein